MAIEHPLYDEVIAWVRTLGPEALTDAIKEHGTDKALAHLIETRGTDHIKEVWAKWQSMSGTEIFAGRNKD